MADAFANVNEPLKTTFIPTSEMRELRRAMPMADLFFYY
jgi:hypothetical protein